MGDWFIATEGVKIVKDSPDLWPLIITAVSSIGAALGGVSLTHHYTRSREEKAALAKREAELYFISTELVFRLERFAQECAAVVQDEGEEDEEGYTRATERATPFAPDEIAGDWRVLPGKVFYRIRELTVLFAEANQYLSFVEENDSPPDWQCTFQERRYQYARLGMKAALLSKRLRKLNHMPSSRLDASEWSAQSVLWEQWRKGRQRRSKLAREQEER